MRQRMKWGALVAMLGLAFWSAGPDSATTPSLTNRALAQEDPEAVGGEAEGGEADNAAEEGGEGADESGPATPPASDDADSGPKKEMSVLAWMWKALGPLYMLVFLGLSFTLVALFVMNLLTARRENVCPVSLIEGFEAHLNDEQYQEAYDLARSDESFLGQVLSAGLAKLSAGYSQAIESMQEVGEEENMKLDHRLSYMALIGTISPMVGLFGTVHGMIRSFSVIAIQGSAPSAPKLAQGISTALFTTLVGLAIAIPAIAAYNILKNRTARLVLEVGIVSEGLMRSAMDNAKKKQPA